MEVASSNPVSILFQDFIYIFIYLLKQLFENNSSFRFVNIALMTANSPYSNELIHSVASRIYNFVFANLQFKVHFV